MNDTNLNTVTDFTTDTVASDGTQFVTETTENTDLPEEKTETVASTAKEGPAGLNQTLPIMGKGMIGIFIVTAAIILVVTLLNKFTSKK